MAYVKQVWQDRVTEYPFRRKLYPRGYDPEDGAEYADIVRAQGEVFEEGTPITAERLNHIENGIFAKQDAINAQNKLPYAYIADVPTVLPNPHPLTFGQKSYDGTASVSLSPADIGLGTVFNLRGSKADASGLPSSGNTVGDVWYVISEHVGYVWLNDGTARWEQLGLPIDLSNCAEIGGTYPGMTVGHAAEADSADTAGHAETADSAETAGYADVAEYAAYADQLDSTVALTVSSPFVFRPAGGGADVEGYLGSKANVTAICGNTLVWNQLVDSDTTAVTLVSGHVYLTRVDGVDTRRTGSGASVSVTGGTDNVFDLTRMFGGVGVPASVEAFRALFPLSYYAYDAGRLMNFAGTGLRTTGFNALAPDGTARLLGGKAYEIVGTYTALSYSTGETITPVSRIFTPSSDGVLTVSGAAADTCVHLVWSGYRNGQTAPYHADTKALPVTTYFPDGMKSARTVRDELRADKAIKRLTAIDLGTLSWHKTAGRDTWVYADQVSAIKQVSNYAAAANMISDTFDVKTWYDVNSLTPGICVMDKSIRLYDNGSIIGNFANLTATQLKQFLSGKIIYVEMQNPAVTSIEPPIDTVFTSSDYGTEILLPENTSAPVTSPMYADIRYTQNLRDKLQRLPCSPESAGWYFVRYDGVRQSYERIPPLPAESGSYVLKCTVGEQEHTFFWETEADTE